jgi:hypothetical protein
MLCSQISDVGDPQELIATCEPCDVTAEGCRLLRIQIHTVCSWTPQVSLEGLCSGLSWVGRCFTVMTIRKQQT